MPATGPFLINGALWSTDASGKVYSAEPSTPDVKTERGVDVLRSMLADTESRLETVSARLAAVEENKAGLGSDDGNLETLIEGATP